MSLSFSNQQIINITKDIILIPSLINDPVTGYIAQKALVLASKDSLQKTDADQKTFSDFWISVVTQYHNELHALNSELRTNYSDSDLVLGGSQTGGHFPTSPIWINLLPKLIQSNNGLPITNPSDLNLLNYLNDVSNSLPPLLTGFNDGNYTDTITITSASTFTSSVVSFPINTRLVVTNGGNSFIIKITSITTVPSTVYNFSVVTGSVILGSATAVSNFSGFTDAQRSGSASTSPYTAIYTSLTASIDTYVSNLLTFINSILTFLNNNGDLSPRKSHITSAKSIIQTAITDIQTWQALPSSTSNGRFTDLKIALVQTAVANLTSYRTNRITEIGTDLGSVAQASDGTASGSGAYKELFTVICLRIAKGSGTLNQVNQIDLGLGFFDQKIAAANDQLNQYTNTFALTKISSDTIIGQISFVVDDASQFSNGDTVYVMDNNTLVYTRIINNISGSTITLDTGIPVALSTTNLARIAKQR